MTIGRAQPAPTAPPQPTDWTRSLSTFVASFMLGVLVMFLIALVTALSTGRWTSTLWMNVVSDWSIASGAHVAWSAPLLTASAGTLATLSNTSLGNDEKLRHALTVAAHTMAVGAALWMTSAIVSMLVPAAPEVWATRQQLWGVILVAGPAVVGAGLIAGRFPRIGPEARLAAAEKDLLVVDEQLRQMRPRAHANWSMRRARSAAWLPPIAVLITCVIATVLFMTTQGVTPARTVRNWTASLAIFHVMWGVPLVLLRVLWNQPHDMFWRPGRRATRRRPTALGVGVIGILSTVIALILVTTIAVIVGILTDPGSHGLPNRLVYATILGGGTLALAAVLLSPHRGRNAWATVGYLTKVHFRDGIVKRIEAARTELELRRDEIRSRSLLGKLRHALQRRGG